MTALERAPLAVSEQVTEETCKNCETTHEVEVTEYLGSNEIEREWFCPTCGYVNSEEVVLDDYHNDN